MSIAKKVIAEIAQLAPGKLFGYLDLVSAKASPKAVSRTLSRLVKENKLKRFSKGQYYIPEKGITQPTLNPSSDEILQSIIYRGTKQIGYITGARLYNELGLTTQVPMVTTIAMERIRPKLDFGDFQIRFVRSRAPINKANVILLQYLDVLRNFQKIPDTTGEQVLSQIVLEIDMLGKSDISKIQKIAASYYNPATIAVLGLILSKIEIDILSLLKKSLNPLTTFKLAIGDADWREKYKWNIV